MHLPRYRRRKKPKISRGSLRFCKISPRAAAGSSSRRSSPRCRPRSSLMPLTRSIRHRRKSPYLINISGSPRYPARQRVTRANVAYSQNFADSVELLDQPIQLLTE